SSQAIALTSTTTAEGEAARPARPLAIPQPAKPLFDKALAPLRPRVDRHPPSRPPSPPPPRPRGKRRGRPGRLRSPNPPSPSSTKRLRHFDTVLTATPSRPAIRMFCSPSAAASTILARSTPRASSPALWRAGGETAHGLGRLTSG